MDTKSIEEQIKFLNVDIMYKNKQFSDENILVSRQIV